MKQITVGRWNVPLPQGMKVIENEDSVQFVAEDRVLYFSGMEISGKRAGIGTKAAELHTAFGKAQPHDHELSGPEEFGYAKVDAAGDGAAEIKATRESDGSVLTCVFSLSTRKDIDWALSLWRDIKPVRP